MNKCSLCDTNEYEYLFSGKNPDLGKTFDVVKCSNCGLKRTLLPENFDFSNYYQKQTYFAKKTSLFNRLKKHFGYILKIRPIEKYKNGGAILDVGSGDGEVLSLYDDKKWKRFGIEPFGNNNTDQNIKIVEKEFNNTDFNNNIFDVVTFWHVFEHVTNPNEVLREVHRIIKKDGLLLISIPNSGSLSYRLYKNRWFALYLPVHVNHYNIETITKILNKNRFEIRKIQKFTYEYAPFVILQTIQNALGIIPDNSLYKSLRGIEKNWHIKLVSYILIPLALPFAFIIMLMEYFDQKGSCVINVYAKPIN